jgi:pimeloyl-ACP methyl ester carboxylesterase
VITFDQRAHGMSEGRISSLPDFVLTLRAMGRRFGRPAAFIGHSMGASSRLYACLWPHAQMMSTEGLGHNRMLDHPSVIDAAMEFVAE